MKNPVVGKPGVNYYALLGVTSTATQDEITKAFRKKILQVHLDKMGPEDDTELCYLTIEAHRILSDKQLRAKYDVERSSNKDYRKCQQEELFIPAGYICYDVGHQQMSRQLMERISGWATEYEKCANELSDNYFQCFSQMMTQVMCDNEDGNDNRQSSSNKLPPPLQHYYCPVCDKNFVTETQHWDMVVNPYRAMFFSGQQGIPALLTYFQNLIGEKLFNYEPRHLPSRLLGIWASPEWSTLTVLHHEASSILKKCDYPTAHPSCSTDDTEAIISKLETLMENDGCSSSRSCESFLTSHTSFLRRSLIQNLIWVLENKSQVEQMISRMSELLCQDDLQEILCLGMAMRNVLSFQQSEWEQLIQDALKEEQFELAMLWTMVAIESGDKSRSDWFQLGMTIRSCDPVLAHFCFLLSGCDTTEAWEDLADIFTRNGAHYAAIEYHLNKGNIFQLLHKSRALQRLDPEGAAIYSGVYRSTRVKGLLSLLSKRSRQCSSDFNEENSEELEELIEIVQDFTATLNPLEGFRIIVSTWPDVFEEAPGYWIHRATIQFLRRGRINLKSAKLILAAAHFLPADERQEEISILSEESSQLTRELLERAQETNDFELLTDVLMHLNKRLLPTAEAYLEEINPPKMSTPHLDDNKEDKEDGNGSENSEKMEKQEDNADEESQAQQPTPPPPQETNAPGHKSALVLLLSGTVHKVKREWLDAMKDYQSALLSAPECMHRVLPCVSKLVQDIQFHEAVVSQVQKEIEELQSNLVNGVYPDIDLYSSDQKPSLILTDVAPKMDYGYKDCVGKIQADPDKIPGPPPEDEPMDAPPPPPANTPMVTLDKNEEAIQSGQSDGQMDQLSAALAYVDLLKALPLQMHPGPIVMAASHFLRAMDEDSEEIGKLYAYRNAIMLMAENLLRVDRKLQATIHHGLTHKHMLSILLSSHEKLSKALVAKKLTASKNGEAAEGDKEVDDEENKENNISPTCNKNDEEENDDDIIIDVTANKDKEKRDLIRKSEAQVISKFLKNVVNFPKVEPLASIPTLNCSDLVYVETMGNSFLSQFCADKLRQKHQSPMIPKHLHAYTQFVEVWKGRSTLSDFPQVRVKAMEELLALRGWTMGDVERKMSWPFLTIQGGFSPPVQCLLCLRDPFRSYRSIDGFQIDYETGSVALLLSRDTMNPVDTLFDVHDIRDVVSLSRTGLMDKIVYSLETPDSTLTSHPFKEARISMGPNNSNSKTYSVQASQKKIWSQIPEYIQATLSRVSMLLCYLASGLEVSSEMPFWMRGAHEGLLSRLDEHLQHLARPVPWRKAERRQNEEKKSPFEMETINKFWLNMVEVFEEIDEEENESCTMIPGGQLTYRVGHMRTEVRPNTFVMTLDPTKKAKLSPEAEFARDLTRNFHEIGRAFPELLRLEELVKISVVCSKLRQVLKENKAIIQEYSGSTSCDSKQTELNAISKVCSTIEKFLGLKPDRDDDMFLMCASCNWFPAVFCHNMDPDAYDVTVGIELDPVVTYGPVSPPSKPIMVPLSKITNLEDLAVQNSKEAMEVPTAQVNKTVIHDEEVTIKTTDAKCAVGDDEDHVAHEDCISEKDEISESLLDVPEESEEETDEEEEEEESDNEAAVSKSDSECVNAKAKLESGDGKDDEELMKTDDDISLEESVESEDELDENDISEETSCRLDEPVESSQTHGGTIDNKKNLIDSEKIEKDDVKVTTKVKANNATVKEPVKEDNEEEQMSEYDENEDICSDNEDYEVDSRSEEGIAHDSENESDELEGADKVEEISDEEAELNMDDDGASEEIEAPVFNRDGSALSEDAELEEDDEDEVEEESEEEYEDEDEQEEKGEHKQIIEEEAENSEEVDCNGEETENSEEEADCNGEAEESDASEDEAENTFIPVSPPSSNFNGENKNIGRTPAETHVNGNANNHVVEKINKLQQNSCVIDGKFPIRTRKAMLDSESKTRDTNNASLTKRSFLSRRRGRLVVEDGPIVTNKSEQKESSDEDESLILSK